MATKTQILDAAETLFAEHGFADTSLRSITTKAKVNLASVNYHFGSKKMMIQAVLERYLSVLMPQIDVSLGALLEETQHPTSHQVFSALVAPLLKLNEVRFGGSAIFVQLLGRGYTESQGHLRKYITAHYGNTLSRFFGVMKLSVPDLPENEVFWRLHFAVGTFVFTMASSQALSDIAQADYAEHVDINDIIHKMVPYIASGFAAGFNG